MIDFDVIFLSFAKDEHLKNVTLNALNTLFASESETEINFNAFVFESNHALKPYEYPLAKETIYSDDKFNYNAYMNKGFLKGSAEYVAFCNNDLEFKNLWGSKIIHYMKKYNLNSASPYCTLTHGNHIINEEVFKGLDIGRIIAGWCIVVKRKFFEQLGGFNEDVSFYCSDTIYGEQLKAINEQHGLITRSIVNHLGSATLKKVDKHIHNDLTLEQTKKFNRMFDKNILGVGK